MTNEKLKKLQAMLKKLQLLMEADANARRVPFRGSRARRSSALNVIGLVVGMLGMGSMWAGEAYFGTDKLGNYATARVTQTIICIVLSIFMGWYWRVHQTRELLSREIHFNRPGRIAPYTLVHLVIEGLAAVFVVVMALVVGVARPPSDCLHPVASALYTVNAALCLIVGIGVWTYIEKIVWSEIRDYRSFLRLFRKTREQRIQKVAYSISHKENFLALLESEVEGAFTSITLQCEDSLLLIAPLSPKTYGSGMAVDVEFPAEFGRRVVDAMRKEFPDLPLGMTLTRSHPAMREGFLPEGDEQLADLLQAVDVKLPRDEQRARVMGDGAYIDQALGYIKNWFSPEDRDVLKQLETYCQNIGLLVWGISYEKEFHHQLRPGYDFTAFRASKTSDEACTDQVLPTLELEATPEIFDRFRSGFGAKVLAHVRERCHLVSLNIVKEMMEETTAELKTTAGLKKPDPTEVHQHLQARPA